MSRLNQWEQAIIDSLRYALHSRRSATITADEVHIPMNAMEEYAEVREIIADIPPERLREICEAERDGRCVVLPCKVGDYLWLNSRYCNRNVPPEKVPCLIYPNCKGCPFKKIEPTPIKVCSMATLGGFLDRNEIGKVLYLTRAEAEAALAGKDGEK